MAHAYSVVPLDGQAGALCVFPKEMVRNCYEAIRLINDKYGGGALHFLSRSHHLVLS